MQNKQLIVGDENTTKKDSLAILNRLRCENPDCTIEEFLDKQLKIRMILN